MTIECTIRFADPRASADRFLETVMTEAEARACKYLVGGFHFRTERSAATIIAKIDSEGFDMTDFENIEFRPL